MLNQIVKEKGLTASEKHLVQLSEKTFLGLWSYPNVYTDEGYTKNKQGKELCDLLIVFGKKIIIFSDKGGKEFKEGVDVKVAWGRWLRETISSSKQLYGAESWLKKYPSRLFLDKECKKKFPLNIEDDIEIFLVTVTKNSAKAAEKYFSKKIIGSSGTLIQVYPFSKDECLNNPFIISDLNPNKNFVHILDEITLELLLSRLDTIHDFISYLKVKEKSIRSGYLHLVAGEEELLAHYFNNMNNNLVGDIPKPTGEHEGSLITISEGLWAEFEGSEIDVILNEFKEKSKYWDELISNFSNHILSATVGLGMELSIDVHERAVKYLASENRVSRGVLCEAFEDKLNSVPEESRSARLAFSPLHKDFLYVFLFVPRDFSGISDNEYRKSRKVLMEAYSLVAKHQNPKAKHVIVIATETKNAEKRSEDIYSAEYKQGLTDEEKDIAKKLMVEDNILNHTKKLNSKNISHPSRPYINMQPKVGRNDICLCGSGKKYKHCCLS